MDKIQITEEQLEELIEYMKSVDEREFTNLSQQFVDIDFDCNIWVWFNHNSLLGAYLKRFWLKGVQGPIPEPPF